MIHHSLSTISNSFSSRRRNGVLFLMLLALLIGCSHCGGGGVGVTERICEGDSDFGRSGDQCIGFPLTSTGPDIEDGGIIDADPGWDDAFRLELGDREAAYQTVVHGVRDSEYIYLSIEVSDDNAYNITDAIVLTFDPDGAAENFQRIHIYPLYDSGAGSDGLPREVHYWLGATLVDPDGDEVLEVNWPDTATAVNPDWLRNDIRVSQCPVGAPPCWTVEMRLRIQGSDSSPGLNLPSSDDFGFFLDVIRIKEEEVVRNGEVGIRYPANEDEWPRDVKIAGASSPTVVFIEDTPEVSEWGNAILGTISNGIGFIGALQVSPRGNNEIEPREDNDFTARVYNTMSDSSGRHLTANAVTARFSAGYLGLPGPGDWIPIGSDGPHDITGIEQSFEVTWPASETDYDVGQKVCIRAELSTTSADTLILNDVRQANMSFEDTSSPFSETAVIGTSGYALPEGATQHDFILTEFVRNTDQLAGWTSVVQADNGTLSGDRVRQLDLPASYNSVNLRLTITPPDITIPREIVTVMPRQPAQAEINVTPNSVMTLFARGNVTFVTQQGGGAEPNVTLSPESLITIGPTGDLGGDLVDESGPITGPIVVPTLNLISVSMSPDGRALDAGLTEQLEFALDDQYAPASQVGALIGSFDGFDNTSFVIGSATTIVVPENAKTLSLAVNGSSGQEGEWTGSYQVEVMQTPMSNIPSHAILVRGRGMEPAQLTLGFNLPTWVMCGERRTGATLVINDEEFDVVEDMGCFGYIIKSIGGK